MVCDRRAQACYADCPLARFVLLGNHCRTRMAGRPRSQRRRRDMDEPFDLIVASHLRWSFVWQRPQQLLSRLAKDRRILFVEEPVHAADGETSLSPLLQE